MSVNDSRSPDRSTDTSAQPTMDSVSHTNPHTGSTLGEVFRRGPAVPDGGEECELSVSPTNDTGSTPSDLAQKLTAETMADVDHGGDASDVNGVWERGQHPNTHDNRRSEETDGDNK